jgi:putative IMPACT (imprinted ancient) family translation regulator
VLDVLPRAEHIETRRLLVALDYSSYELARRVLEAHQATIEDEAFAADITLTVMLPASAQAACEAALASVTAGQAQIQEV